MPSSYTNLLVHLVFGTKNRRDWITPDKEHRLFEYIGGIIRGHKCVLAEIGGMSDHLHLLLKLHADCAVAPLVREIKSESTSWVKRTFGSRTPCGWQRGYGAFSVSHSTAPSVRTYIRNQKRHHATRKFDEEAPLARDTIELADFKVSTFDLRERVFYTIRR